MMHEQDAVVTHFDEVAKQYDYWKQKNWFYYDTLKAITAKHVNPQDRLLDSGCGTGALLRAAGVRDAVGIDISPEMIAIAKERNADHPEFQFQTADIITFRSESPFDAILFYDVIEHVPDTRAALASLYQLLAPGGRLILSMANPLWEPILMLAEKLGLKMPEGPHYRVPTRQFLKMAQDAGFILEKREWYLLFPKSVPALSWFLNDIIGRIPLIERLSVIEVFILTKS